MILGDRSGGGTCGTKPASMADGLYFFISGPTCLVNKANESIDTGIVPDVQLVKQNEDGTKDYSGLYDPSQIRNGISEYYGESD